MGRVTCADLAELRSAYIDQALGPADRDRVLRHLSGCDRCRAEMEDLRQVRSILTHRMSARPGERPPAHLPDRLLAIAERPSGRQRSVRGIEVASPRWTRLRRRAAASVAAVGLGVVAATGLGLAAAPARTLTPVADPRAEASAELGDVIQQLPFGNQAAAALADAPGADVAAIPSGRPADVGRGSALSGAQLQNLLVLVAQADARNSYSGEQQYFADRADDRVVARLTVANQPDQGRHVVAYDRSGVQVGEHTRAPEATSRLSGDAAAALLGAGHRLSARSTTDLLGRATVLLEAHSPAGAGSELEARWWIDRATGVVLWQETYRGDGELVLSTGFTRLELGRSTPIPVPEPRTQTTSNRTSASLTLSRADALAEAGWACSDRLADLPLVRLRSDAATDPGVVHMVYSDGVRTVSVVEQRGRLAAEGADRDAAWDGALGAYVERKGLTSASWQSGESVVTVITDAPEVLSAVVTALPHESLRSPSTMERVVAGWARILGLQ